MGRGLRDYEGGAVDTNRRHEACCPPAHVAFPHPAAAPIFQPLPEPPLRPLCCRRSPRSAASPWPISWACRPERHPSLSWPELSRRSRRSAPALGAAAAAASRSSTSYLQHPLLALSLFCHFSDAPHASPPPLSATAGAHAPGRRTRQLWPQARLRLLAATPGCACLM